ncbi:MAG: hypothetical protein KatS3mg084_0453 [Candidatus Dojkabacteria bacterium]|nr:MAG: hypothetical protein KatS3mg084_0453 [Candidatus Dojkabacteria bacterium]
MKVKTSLKPRCEHCYMVRRGKTLFVYCKRNRRHNQRQWRGHGKNVKKTRKGR